jgi:hypothetical protein
MFMETYVLDEKLKSYVELYRDKLFAKKHLMGGMIEAFKGSSIWVATWVPSKDS